MPLPPLQALPPALPCRRCCQLLRRGGGALPAKWCQRRSFLSLWRRCSSALTGDEEGGSPAQASRGGGLGDAVEVGDEDRRLLGASDAQRMQIEAAPRFAGIGGSCGDHRTLQAGRGAVDPIGACNSEVEVATERVMSRRRRLWRA
jgi:hypothetical protein